MPGFTAMLENEITEFAHHRERRAATMVQPQRHRTSSQLLGRPLTTLQHERPEEHDRDRGTEAQPTTAISDPLH